MIAQTQFLTETISGRLFYVMKLTLATRTVACPHQGLARSNVFRTYLLDVSLRPSKLLSSLKLALAMTLRTSQRAASTIEECHPRVKLPYKLFATDGRPYFAKSGRLRCRMILVRGGL